MLRSDHWRKVAEQLRERPYVWAVVLDHESFSYAGGMGAQIKRASLAAFRPAGSFDACTRTTEHGYTVYARYIGESK